MTEIAIRAYTVTKESYFAKNYPKLAKKQVQGTINQVFDRILVFDTETTTDLYQNLKFGYFESYQYGILELRGICYDSEIVKPKEKLALENYSKENKIPLCTITEFRDIFLHEVYSLETLCVGFNLPFDLTRIAIKSGNGRERRKDSFSLELSTNLNYPRLHITHATNTLSFIKFGTTRNESKQFGGYFVDLRTMCHALTDKKHSLDSACKAFGTQYQKEKAKEHGKINHKYISYCINDVKATYSLYQDTKKEFDSYNLGIPIIKAYTPASIGKQFLKQMGINSFIDKNPKFSTKIIGQIMTGYFGGRTECKIRKTPVQVDLLDFLSMYPTVCILQKLWKFVIADHIEYIDTTNEIINFVANFTIKDIQNKENWAKLQAIVLVEPQDDILPIRARFDQKHVWNIGISHLTSKTPLWYSLADIIASKLYTGKTPKILQAIKFIPVGEQKGLQEINIHGAKINPYTQDLFQELIEYRQKLKNERNEFSKEDSQYWLLDRKQNIIKIITNAISYGIFVEINTFEELDKCRVNVFGLEQFQQSKNKIEQFGFMFNPIIAISITSASRLLLAVTEVLLAKHGTTHAYCDTDSMAIPAQYTKNIQEFFQPLNPYNFNADIFKCEEHEIWFYGISSKRYCLYRFEKDQIKIEKENYSSHGLGHLLDPFSNEEKTEWHLEIWKDILGLHYGNITREELVEKYQNKYALSKLVISNPRILDRFKEFNKGREYKHQIKPSNFSILGYSNAIDENTFQQIKPLAPFTNPAKDAVYDYFVDYNDKNRRKLRGKEYWKTFSDILRDYLSHQESKFDGDKGILERKHVTVTKIVHIGKESNNLDESETLGVDSNSYEMYEDDNIDSKFKKIAKDVLKLNPRNVKKFEISKQTLWNVKKKIKINQINRISDKIKNHFLRVVQIDHIDYKSGYNHTDNPTPFSNISSTR
ncbi:MAG TPA: hypothetical protein VGR54_02855 [Nitrosopumilaceae archaeon]|nr:hypothetical protein [Nitrosopumilaceae archaeon]